MNTWADIIKGPPRDIVVYLVLNNKAPKGVNEALVRSMANAIPSTLDVGYVVFPNPTDPDEERRRHTVSGDDPDGSAYM